MMRSMFSAVSGLKVHQTKMDVIANNIANVNTIGFKSSRVTFKEAFSQTVAAASAANENTGRGGTNPMQIGLGLTLGSIDKIMSQGASQRTDNPLDLMISGSSFFTVSDVSGTYFTRNGAFILDTEGNITNSQGLRLMGWDSMDDPNNPGQQIIDKSSSKPIVIGPDKQFMYPESTSTISLEGNLNADKDPTVARSITFYDSLGNQYTADTQIKYDPATTSWTMTPVSDVAYINGDRSKPVAGVVGDFTTNIKFDTNGKIIDPPDTDGYGFDITLDAANLNPEATFGDAGNNILRVVLKDLRQTNDTTSAKAYTLDGNSPGNITGLSVDQSGIITGKYSNGGSRVLGQISVANFKNPSGLDSIGNNLYISTPNSGSYDGMGEEVGISGGSIMSNTLEMSNVDLSYEFTELITTQRGFQANSRTITTSDEMLQELVNLKR